VNQQDPSSPHNLPEQPPDAAQAIGRLAGWLHDYPAQAVTAVRLRLHHLRSRAPEFEAELAELEALLEQAGGQLRRAIRGEHPGADPQGPLADAMRAVVAEVQRLYRIECDLPQDVKATASGAQADLILCCLREGLINAAKHAGATRCTLTLGIDDKAIGFELSQCNGEAEAPGHDKATAPAVERLGGTGLRTLSDRAAALGGRLRLIPAQAPGEQTRMLLELPRGSAEPIDTEKRTPC